MPFQTRKKNFKNRHHRYQNIERHLIPSKNARNHDSLIQHEWNMSEAEHYYSHPDSRHTGVHNFRSAHLPVLGGFITQTGDSKVTRGVQEHHAQIQHQ